MSITHQEGRHINADLAAQAAAGASAAQLVGSLAGLWQQVDRALAPIVGPRGVAALHQRSFHLSAQQQGWQVPPPAAGTPAQGPEHLAALLAALDAPAAAAGGDAFLHNFHTLLASLIGPSLTDRLLQQVRPPQDTPP